MKDTGGLAAAAVSVDHFPYLPINRMGENRRGAATGGVGHRDFTSKVSQGVTRHGESHADAHRVLGADERLEHLVADVRVESAAMKGKSGVE